MTNKISRILAFTALFTAIVLSCVAVSPVMARYITENTWDIVISNDETLTVESNLLGESVKSYDFGTWYSDEGGFYAPIAVAPVGGDVAVSFDITSTNSELVGVTVADAENQAVADGESAVFELSVIPASDLVKESGVVTDVTVSIVCNCTCNDKTVKLYGDFQIKLLPDKNRTDKFYTSNTITSSQIFVDANTVYIGKNIMHFEVASDADTVAVRPKNSAFTKGTRYVINGENKMHILPNDGYMVVPGRSSFVVISDSLEQTDFTVEAHVSNAVRRDEITVTSPDEKNFVTYRGAPLINTTGFDVFVKEKIPFNTENANEGFGFVCEITHRNGDNWENVEISPAKINVRKESSEDGVSVYSLSANQTGISPGVYNVLFKRTFSGVVVEEQNEPLFVDYR